MKIFISYHHKVGSDGSTHPDPLVAERVSYYLQKQTPLHIFCLAGNPMPNSWTEQVAPELSESDAFVLIAGRELGASQCRETKMAWDRRLQSNLVGDQKCPQLLVVSLGEPIPWPPGEKWADEFSKITPIEGIHEPIVQNGQVHEGIAQSIAHQICKRLGLGECWRFDFEIPYHYPFDYEKDIIKEFRDGKGELSRERQAEGCPKNWPSVPLRSSYFNLEGHDHSYDNPVPPHLIGTFSDEQSPVLVYARDLRSEVPSSEGPNRVLTFNEARPRQRLRLPDPDAIAERGNSLRVGIIVSGGIAPGINSVIAGIVERHRLYQDHYNQKYAGRNAVGFTLEIFGYQNGFRSLEVRPPRCTHLASDNMRRTVRDMANRGGSLLGTSRLDGLLNSAEPLAREKTFVDMVDNLTATGIDVLYVIGGDGSMRAAHALQVAARQASYPVTVVGIPKTMDNDIFWVWQSFGFLSAVEKAKEFIMQLHTEARSNPRLCVMQLFGSDSGFVVSHAALASGVVDLALIPEIAFSMRQVANYIKGRLYDQYRKAASPYGLVLMAETAIPTDVEELMQADRRRDPDKRVLRLEQEEEAEIRRYLGNGRRVRGQTPDALRTGGLKIVSRILQYEIKGMEPRRYWNDYRVFTNEPRHLLRSLEPSSSDIIFGHRLGCLAVDNAMAGFTDFMVSQWLTEFVLVPLRLVALGRKRVPKEGIFWRSVLDSTGQDEDMDQGGPPLAFVEMEVER